MRFLDRVKATLLFLGIIEGLPYRNYMASKLYIVGGNLYWKDDRGRLHRDHDKPAEIWADGTKFWHQHGKLHRDEDKPAEIWFDGTMGWHQHGKLHRDNNLPAIIYANGYKAWWQHDKFIREELT